jgi:uncharacterized protein (DUF2249 family)
MTIDANTKIAALIKQQPAALEAIISISSKFTKLRNPVLRKVIGGRTSIAMASKLGGCSINDFFDKLRPLGFKIDDTTSEVKEEQSIKAVPTWVSQAQMHKIVTLDVRPVFETGQDPLQIILATVKTLKQDEVLKLINSFEPTPLLHLLGKKGFQSFVEKINPELVRTYFYKTSDEPAVLPVEIKPGSIGWDDVLTRFKEKMKVVDVRQMEMPLPMHTILEALDSLPANEALFVYHKRIPVFLLPELEERKFTYRINEVSDAEVHLLIYKD